jgi:hypothetical protein
VYFELVLKGGVGNSALPSEKNPKFHPPGKNPTVAFEICTVFPTISSTKSAVPNPGIVASPFPSSVRFANCYFQILNSVWPYVLLISYHEVTDIRMSSDVAINGFLFWIKCNGVCVEGIFGNSGDGTIPCDQIRKFGDIF